MPIDDILPGLNIIETEKIGPQFNQFPHEPESKQEENNDLNSNDIEMQDEIANSDDAMIICDVPNNPINQQYTQTPNEVFDTMQAYDHWNNVNHDLTRIRKINNNVRDDGSSYSNSLFDDDVKNNRTPTPIQSSPNNAPS